MLVLDESLVGTVGAQTSLDSTFSVSLEPRFAKSSPLLMDLTREVLLLVRNSFRILTVAGVWVTCRETRGALDFGRPAL